MTDPGGVRYLQLQETHCAGVLLVGDLALKFKKPVDLGFLDFRAVEARRDACRREVALNRRFAPDVYRGVGTLQLPEGPAEPLVVMRRMPEDRRLSTLVHAGTDVRGDVRRLARQLAVVHADSPRRPEIDLEASPDRLRGRWEQSFGQVRRHVRAVRRPEVLDEVERLVRQFLDGRRALLRARVVDGCAVDGHGDLLADDIFYLHDGPRALDCLEFDDRLRYVDRLDDACFLAMDLERLGKRELAADFVDAYAEYAGDNAPPSLVHHYVAYRAFVRAKVACLRSDQGVRAEDLVEDHLELAARHLRAGAVTLALVGGPPGSGKTTIAGGLADRSGAVLLSADRVRKELAGLDPGASAAAGYGGGIYSAEYTRRTYAELVRRADALLTMGESVVLDATWSAAQWRQAAREMAQRTHSDIVELACSCDPDTTLRRVARRTNAPTAGSPARSDAGVLVATAMRREADPRPEASTLDTTGPCADSVQQAVDLLRTAPAARPLCPQGRRTFVLPD